MYRNTNNMSSTGLFRNLEGVPRNLAKNSQFFDHEIGTNNVEFRALCLYV